MPIRDQTTPRRRSISGVVISSILIVALIGGAIAGAVWGLGAARSSGLIGPVAVPTSLRSVIHQAAKRCPAIPAEVLAAQIAAESSWDARAKSPAGAQGIAQFMPRVWEQYGVDANDDGVADVWDPVDAIHSAAALNCINRRLVRGAEGNRLRNTLAAYNAGYAAVLKYGGVPPYPETQAYVERIVASAKDVVLS